MTLKKKSLAITLFAFLLNGCASVPSHLIVTPEILTQTSMQYVDKQATINVIDMRTANQIVQILREGEAATLLSAQSRLEETIENSLRKHWQQQGLSFQDTAVNSITIAIESALISVSQETLKYQAQSKIVLKVTVNNGEQTLTSSFKNSGSSNGPFKADIAVLERNFNQRLANLLQQILANKKINHFLK